MTGRQFEEQLKDLFPKGDFMRQAAGELGVNKSTVWRWCNGESPIPKTAEMAVELLFREREEDTVELKAN